MADYGTLTDLELTGLLRKDDKSAFAAVYSRYWKKMLMVAWNHTKDKALAEDVVHEIFLALWEKRKEEILNVPAFLATCIKFRIFKHYQREQRRTQLAIEHYDFKDIALDEEKLDALFLKEYIDGIIEKLPEKSRLTFQYSRIDGLSNAEVAEKMNISEKGVEANLTRALKVIRGNLKDSGLLILLSESLWKHFF